MPEVDIDPDDDISILYTSGTTGHPKGAVSTHRALLNALLAFAARAAVGGLTDPAEPGAPPCFTLAVPLFHVTGLVPVMLGSFVGGAKLVIMHRWDPGRALELIEQEKVTNFVGVPMMSWDLLEHPSFAERDTSTLRSVGGGGAAMPPELVKRIEDNFPNGRPGLGYGMTETNAYGPQNSGDAFLEHPTSTGRPVPIMDVRVTDPEGNPLPVGETGEIWFRSPMLICGYWNRPEATADTIVDGWLRTGDIGRIDQEGFVYVSDRAKDMVLRAGENVYSAEVEAAFYEHRIGDKRVTGLVKRSCGPGSSVRTPKPVRRSPGHPRAESCHRCWPTLRCRCWTSTSPRNGKRSARHGLVPNVAAPANHPCESSVTQTISWSWSPEPVTMLKHYAVRSAASWRRWGYACRKPRPRSATLTRGSTSWAGVSSVEHDEARTVSERSTPTHPRRRSRR